MYRYLVFFKSSETIISVLVSSRIYHYYTFHMWKIRVFFIFLAKHTWVCKKSLRNAFTHATDESAVFVCYDWDKPHTVHFHWTWTYHKASIHICMANISICSLVCYTYTTQLEIPFVVNVCDYLLYWRLPKSVGFQFINIDLLFLAVSVSVWCVCYAKSVKYLVIKWFTRINTIKYLFFEYSKRIGQ